MQPCEQMFHSADTQTLYLLEFVALKLTDFLFMSIYLSILTDHSYDSQDADELEDQSNLLQHSVMSLG